MSQVTFVAAGAQTTSTNGNVTPALPAGIADNDLLLVVWSISDNARTITAPTGWSTATYARDTAASNGPSLGFVWKACVVATDTAPLLTIGGTSHAGAGVTAKVFAYRNADVTVGPVFGSTFTSGTTTGTSVGAISGVSVTGLGLALAIGAWADNWTSAPSTPSGWTLETNGNNSGATIGNSWAVFDKATNNTTSASVTISGTPAASTTRCGVQIAINEGTQTWSGSLTATGVGSSSLSGFDTISASATTATGAGSTSISQQQTDLPVAPDLTATAAGTESLSGFETHSSALAAVGAGTESVSGFDTISVTLTATGAGTESVSGSETHFGTLSGVAAGTETVSGFDTIGSGTITAAGHGAATTTGFDTIPSGTITGVGIGTELLNPSGTESSGVGSSGSGSSSIGALVNEIASITGTGAGASSASGVDTISAVLSALGVGSTSLTAEVDLSFLFTGTGTGSATVAGLVTEVATLTGVGVGSASLAQQLIVLGTITATAHGTATDVGAIVRLGTITAIGSGAELLTGHDVLTGLPITALAVGQVAFIFGFAAGPPTPLTVLARFDVGTSSGRFLPDLTIDARFRSV